MARWDDLFRAIDARDTEGAEPIWLELLEKDLDSQARFLSAARKMAGVPGGKRQAGMLLWLLAEALKEKGRHLDLLSVYAELAGMAPDDGTLRQALVETARAAHPDRPDLDSLLEKSGIEGGPAPELAQQARTLERYLKLQPGAYVYHKSGWGIGRIVGYAADRSRCVIDFRDKPGHEMDIDAAADRLELLPEDDIRALAMADPKGLRKKAADQPLEMIRQVLGRFGGATALRHVKDALVPDAVATSRWSSWWKEAKRLALLDPRFHVGSGRDPKIEFNAAAKVDFRTQIERSFMGAANVVARQKAARELFVSAAGDEEALKSLAEKVEKEALRAGSPALKLGWELLLADLIGHDKDEVLAKMLGEAQEPKALLAAITDDATRDIAARGLLKAREDGADLLLQAALANDDPVLAEVGLDRFEAVGHKEYVPRLLDHIDGTPAATPVLYAWYVRGLRRKRFSGRTYEPYALVERLLKVLDAVEYRARRTGGTGERRGVTALGDALTARSGELVKAAAESTDRSGARHLLRVLERNRGLKARALQKIQDMIFRVHPDALKEPAGQAGEPEMGERLDRIYMTADGLERLKREHAHIINEELTANAAEIARAREFGDLSENAEYHAAREKQSLLQARADAMQGEIARAVTLTPDVVRTDAVSVGSKVRLKDKEGHEVTYTLLGPPDTDVARGVINYLTPLGQALMGKKPGDQVTVEVGEERRELEVLDVENGLLVG